MAWDTFAKVHGSCLGVGEVLPLTEDASFEALLQRGNRIQIPVEVRWRYRLEPGEILQVDIVSPGRYLPSRGRFYARLQKSGRVTVPWEQVVKHDLKSGILVAVTLLAGKR